MNLMAYHNLVAWPEPGEFQLNLLGGTAAGRNGRETSVSFVAGLLMYGR